MLSVKLFSHECISLTNQDLGARRDNVVPGLASNGRRLGETPSDRRADRTSFTCSQCVGGQNGGRDPQTHQAPNLRDLAGLRTLIVPSANIAFRQWWCPAILMSPSGVEFVQARQKSSTFSAVSIKLDPHRQVDGRNRFQSLQYGHTALRVHERCGPNPPAGRAASRPLHRVREAAARISLYRKSWAELVSCHVNDYLFRRTWNKHAIGSERMSLSFIPVGAGSCPLRVSEVFADSLSGRSVFGQALGLIGRSLQSIR